MDTLLIGGSGTTSLVAIAREGRLIRACESGPLRVQLTPVDEATLALVDLAITRGRNLAVLYPAPAGEVAVLLAAEILLGRFVQGEKAPAVGLLTADPTAVSRTWEQLRIASPGLRAAVAEVFPCVRCSPDGGSPVRRRGFRGLLVGQRYNDWPADIMIISHLAGPVYGSPNAPTVRIFSDPLDPALESVADAGGLVWGWSHRHLVEMHSETDGMSETSRVPFSVSHERLAAIAGGVRTTIHAATGAVAEICMRRVRDDLRTLADIAGPDTSPTFVKGLRVAWHHLTTLMSLPCRPSQFDRFAGIPPIAARATSSFGPEIAAWAKTLPGDASEFAMVLATDLEDLRVALEEENPFFPELKAAASENTETLIIVRTHTAARALLASLDTDPDASTQGDLSVRSLRRLHREGTWNRAIVVGPPPRWDWHRLDSGLSADLHVLVLGMGDADRSRSALLQLQEARRGWASEARREQVWLELVGGDVPIQASSEPDHAIEISIVAARQAPPEADPFAPFEPILGLSSVLIGEEGLEESVAEEVEDGAWSGVVEAVEVETDAGTVLLPTNRVVEVRSGDRIIDCRAENLKAGMYLLVGRTARRIGLLDAVSGRLARHRPDILAANLLVRDLRSHVRVAFSASRMTKTDLYSRMAVLGFTKTYVAASGYVEEDGPLAPRDFQDLERLNQALGLGLSRTRIREVFAGVQRLRTFRRAAGRALAAAARGSTVAPDSSRVDPGTGLSLADLRDVVIEAEVVRVRRCLSPVSLAEVGQLQGGR